MSASDLIALLPDPAEDGVTDAELHAAAASGDAPFLFDEFFADESRTVTIPVKMMGRTVPITIKAGLSVEDRLAAQRAAVKKQVKPNGEIVFLGLDEGAVTEEMLVRAIVAWPFVDRAGQPVPVTRENIRRMLGGADAIASAIQKLDQEGVDALTPFASPSGQA